MVKANRSVTQGDKSIYVEKGDITVNYGEKKILKNLTVLPFTTEIFLGRANDLTAIHDKLFKDSHPLLLVNGEGGIGKTTLAAHYYRTFQKEYQYMAWVFAERSLLDALLTLALPLQVDFPDNMPARERLDSLLIKMSELEKPCLLVIDNANNLKDLEDYYQTLHSCPNFHIILTTRITEFQQTACHKVGSLKQDDAIILFKKYYPGHLASEDPLLKEILTAIGYNTLVIELISKNLNNLNRLKTNYTLADLLKDLQAKGLLALKTQTVSTKYHADGTALRKESPENIIAAMYDISNLSGNESDLLSVFAVLPAENITFKILETLLPDFENLDTTVLALAQNGWLDNEVATVFKVSPVVQEITRQKKQEKLRVDNQNLISSLIDKMHYEPGIGHFINASYEEASLYARYSESVLNHISETSEEIALLAERLGNYNQTTGNLEKALGFFEKYNRLEKELYDVYSNNLGYKYSLAVSYLKLGEIHTSLGNLEKALGFFKESNRLERELYDAYPNNVGYKYSLAVSYSKLGDTHESLDNLEKALEFFEEHSRLGKELYDANSINVRYKYSLAASYSKLGDTHKSLGNLEKALGFFEESNRLARELYDACPNNVAVKNGLAASYLKLGDTHKSLGNLEKVLGFFEESNRLERELYDAYPNKVAVKNGLAISYINLGSYYEENEDKPKAKKLYLLSKELFAELVSSSPQNVEFKNNLDLVVSILSIL